MPTQGKYIYGIIESDDVRNFGPVGIGGRGDVVSTVGYRDLSVVVSDTSMDKYVINRENMLAHEQVVETVMKEYTILPVRFCTIATSAEEIRSLLRKRYAEFKNMIKDLDNKVELGLKVSWRDKDAVLREIVSENDDIKEYGARLARNEAGGEKVEGEKVELGKKVQDILKKKREAVASEILDRLKRMAADYSTNELTGEDAVLNAVFLVDKNHEKEFDIRVNDLEHEMGDRISFVYVGPAPLYNFANINVQWT